MIRLHNFIRQCILFFTALLASCGAWAADGPASPERLVVIDKAAREVAVFRNGLEAARFPASFGLDPASDKYRAHDLATPEGLYFVAYRKSRTRFHRTLGITYPNLGDAQRALARGIVTEDGYMRILSALRRSRPAPCVPGLGCGIAIHGGGVFRGTGADRSRDWTEGCVALDNRDMEVLFNVCRPGDPVVILNSSRNLYGIIRPFTEVRALDADGLPVCPGGICEYTAELATSLGRARFSVREGPDFMSLKVEVISEVGEGSPLLVVADGNADGHLSFLDSVEGPLAEGVAPDEAYALLREAVLAAFFRGGVPTLEEMPADEPSARGAGPSQ